MLYLCPPHHHLRRNRRYQGHRIAHCFHIGKFQPNAAAGPFATRLRASVTAEHDDQILTDGAKGIVQCKIETLAVGVEDHKAGYSPRQRDHSENAALAIELQSLPCFAKNGLESHGGLSLGA